MAARAQNFICQNCGAAFARWAGKCEACGEWNTLVVEFTPPKNFESEGGKLKNPIQIVSHVNDTKIFEGKLYQGTGSRKGSEFWLEPKDRKNQKIEYDKRIYLQSHWGSTVEFRNLTIADLPQE